MNKIKILVVTDSLGLPRSLPQRVNDDQAWPHMLANNLDQDVYTFSRGGMSSSDIVAELSRNLGAYTPDVLIVQVGIVDCAPRALKRGELRVVSALPILGKIINRIIKKFRKTIVKARRITYTHKDTFKKNIETIEKAFDASTVYFVSILPALREYEEYSPGISKNISDYNKIIEETSQVIFPYTNENLNSITMSDFHHLNHNGHKAIFDSVIKQLFLQ